MEELNSPEQLTDYLRVTGPGIWFVLAGIVTLLAGLLIWGIFGRLITTVHVPAIVTEGNASCYILAEDVDLADEEIEIMIGDVQMQADTGEADTITMSAAAGPDLYASGYLTPGRKVVVLHSKTDLEDGLYDAAVTTETLRPISVLFEKN